ncbi:MAG: IMP dehydrogenase [Parcubacteria group bacterium Gr01-1014_31]|nr:MAG: IMP dehydrogenase [Parcubacteria group bacterium Gr01-1014_31]
MPSTRIPLGLTFDDVLLIPQESSVSPSQADVRTMAARGLPLDIPVLSAAMDTVSGATMVAAMANAGGLGVLHRNCTIEEQVAMVKTAIANAGGKHVAAAVGPRDVTRALALDRAGVTVLVFDSAHVHKPELIATIAKVRAQVKAKIIVGNIVTAAAARALLPLADGIKVGVGPGSICTTRVVAGVGVPQLTAIMDVVKVARAKGIPVIADGGIRYSGDVVKALAAGASAVMLGGMLSGTDEAPGDVVTIDGKQFKAYRGMGSLGAMEGGNSSDRYFQSGAKKYVPEGVEAATPYKGKLADTLYQIVGGLKSGMGYLGAATLPELQRRAHFVQITPAGRAESHPHSLAIIHAAPNYHE